jgi:Tfp pilus assembly protein PilX
VNSRTALIVALVVALVADVVLVAALAAGKGTTAVHKAQAAQQAAEAQLAAANARIAQLQQQLAAASPAPAPTTPLPGITGSPSPTSSQVVVPPVDSPDREAILTAIGAKAQWQKTLDVVKIQMAGDWAYAVVQKKDPANPGLTYDQTLAVCQRLPSGTWTCLEAVDAPDAQTAASQAGQQVDQWFATRYPLAPPAVFQ